MPWPSDPALPQLQLLRDLDTVSAALPGWRATRRLHLRYVPATSCVATYDLVPEGNGAPGRSIGVVAVGRSGIQARLYVDDPALPGLAAVPERATSAGGLGVDGGSATPVRYRPGSRCTLALSDPTGAVRAFAKVLPGAERLRAATGVVEAAGAAVPEELAWWPELACLVQRAVPGAAPLARLLPGRPALAGAAGVALGRLHSWAGAPGWPVVAMGHDLARLEGLRRAVAVAVPEVLDDFDRGLTALRSVGCARAGAAAATVPSHGAFRAGQLVVAGDGRVVVLDLDGTCRSEPARDAGNFLAYLRWQAVRDPDQAPAVAAAREAFLAGYGSVTRPPEAARLAQYEALSLVKIAGRRARDLSVEEWALLPALLDRASDLLEPRHLRRRAAELERAVVRQHDLGPRHDDGAALEGGEEGPQRRGAPDAVAVVPEADAQRPGAHDERLDAQGRQDAAPRGAVLDQPDVMDLADTGAPGIDHRTVEEVTDPHGSDSRGGGR